MNRKFELFLLLLILVGGFAVRLYKIDNPIADWHSWRQADTASVSKTYLEKGVNLLYPRYHDISSIQTGIFNPEGYRFVEFPVYNAINAVLAGTFDNFSIEVWARLITISSALVTGLFLYLIGKKYLGSWGGILSAFFYLFIPYNIYFTRVILPDPFGAMCAVIGLYGFTKFIDTEKHFYLYLSGIVMALALLIKPFYGFYLVPLIYLTDQKFGLKKILINNKLLTKFVAYALVMLVPLLLWRYWEGRHPEGIPFFKWAFNGDEIRFRPAFWRWIFEERLERLILGGWGLILFIFGVLRPKEKNLSPFAKHRERELADCSEEFFASERFRSRRSAGRRYPDREVVGASFIKYFIFAMLLYVTIVATANVRHDYYQIVTMPAIALVLASGTVYLWQNNVFNRIAARILVIFSIPMMIMTGWLLIRDNYNVNHPEIVEAGREVDRITPKDALVIAPYDGDTAFLYQTGRWGWPAIDNSIDNIISEGASYYVSVKLGDKDTKMIEARFKTVEKTDKFIIINLREPLIKK